MFLETIPARLHVGSISNNIKTGTVNRSPFELRGLVRTLVCVGDEIIPDAVMSFNLKRRCSGLIILLAKSGFVEK